MSNLPHLLTDDFGRVVDYLRISVTDRCDFRCVYCMAEKMTFLPRSQALSLDELFQIAAQFISLGTRKIRLTGGEPLVREGIVSLCERIATTHGLEELCITTNGNQLPLLARSLRDAGVTRLNISLDSLDPERFKSMTRTGQLERVIAGIDAALAAGFTRTKINCVVLKGRNDVEVLDLVQFAIDRDLDISFIEEMPLGIIDEHRRSQSYCSSDEVRACLAEQFTLVPSSESSRGPARYWRISQAPNIRVGFISPHSHNFCGSCNRVRLTVEGRLLMCLGNEHACDLRSVIRAYPNDSEQLERAIRQAMHLKPYAHHFDIRNDAVQILRFMNVTGG